MARQWILARQEGFEASLEFKENLHIPSAKDLAPDEVLVKLMAASLNYRELVIPDPKGINGPITPPVIPACDGAGVVEAVGSAVTEFTPGDRVVTQTNPAPSQRAGDDEPLGLGDAVGCLGQGRPGTLTSFGVFQEKGLVHAPKSLNWLEAATLTCTFATGWNALFGVKGKEPGPGAWILVQGTGGVSIATLQLAVAAGATVVATTSSEDRAARLKSLGAAHVVNYKTNPNWGLEARALTPGGRGFDNVVDVGGYATVAQSLAAVRVDGIVHMVGAVGGNAEPVPLMAVFMAACSVRVFFTSTRNQFKELVKFMDAKEVKPAMDDVVFELAEAKEAYRRLNEKKHFAKVMIRIDHEE
ncbi:putative alcohol dehydrogenase [Stachybotrys elegans]|uniref:Alcohol dehydrogenase n=1 Tax=Stachybotrys elegans TaxID=80388 RepID=A0A8K0SV41_9HYPO|nr:putative alcohol dehydrogenase [Stachybotrys elegans]